MNHQDKMLERWVRRELHNVAHNLILRDDRGCYDLFGKYRIQPDHKSCKVYVHSELVGTFSNTKVAVSWCVANKFRQRELAQDLCSTDQALIMINADIDVRGRIAERSRRPGFRENVGTKLETKIIRRKKLEYDLAKYIDRAKYLQQRGFHNETARTSCNT